MKRAIKPQTTEWIDPRNGPPFAEFTFYYRSAGTTRERLVTYYKLNYWKWALYRNHHRLLKQKGRNTTLHRTVVAAQADGPFGIGGGNLRDARVSRYYPNFSNSCWLLRTRHGYVARDD
jgi:hypothetical protein